MKERLGVLILAREINSWKASLFLGEGALAARVAYLHVEAVDLLQHLATRLEPPLVIVLQPQLSLLLGSVGIAQLSTGPL